MISGEVFERLSSPDDKVSGDVNLVGYYLFILTTLNAEKHVEKLLYFINENKRYSKEDRKLMLHQFYYKKSILLAAHENFNPFITSKLVQFDKQTHGNGQSQESAKMASLKCSRHQLQKKSRMVPSCLSSSDSTS